MRRLLSTLALVMIFAGMILAQAQRSESEPQKTEEKSINKEWQEAIRTAEEALRDIEIPDIDVDQIMEDVKEAMPTRDEIEDYKEIVADAVSELKDIDLSGLEEALSELRYELGEIFKDHDWEHRDKKKKDGPKKDEHRE